MIKETPWGHLRITEQGNHTQIEYLRDTSVVVLWASMREVEREWFNKRGPSPLQSGFNNFSYLYRDACINKTFEHLRDIGKITQQKYEELTHDYFEGG